MGSIFMFITDDNQNGALVSTERVAIMLIEGRRHRALKLINSTAQDNMENGRVHFMGFRWRRRRQTVNTKHWRQKSRQPS